MKTEQKGHSSTLQPLIVTGMGYRILILILLDIIGWGAFAYINQLIWGLGMTGMRKPSYWGLYMVNFVFFIGISHAGTLISAILRVSQAEWRRPITRAAEAITVFALCIGAPQVLFDLGRIDRIMNVVYYGRFQSPILWDVACIGTYLVVHSPCSGKSFLIKRIGQWEWPISIFACLRSMGAASGSFRSTNKRVEK